MNRFFSKLDLRDIKIDPAGSRFPPDADEEEVIAPEVAAAPSEAEDEPGTSQADGPEIEDGASSAWQAADSRERSEVVVRSTASLASLSETTTTYTVEETSVIATATNGHGDGTANGALSPIDTAALLGAEFIDAVAVSVDEVLKVSARSRPSAVAGAIAGVVRECGRAEVQAIGAGATNQAVKAVAIARDYLRETGIDAVCLPAFIDVTIENEDRTAIRLVVEVR